MTVPRLDSPAVSAPATASATGVGTCEPPGPSKYATPRSSAGEGGADAGWVQGVRGHAVMLPDAAFGLGDRFTAWAVKLTLVS